MPPLVVVHKGLVPQRLSQLFGLKVMHILLIRRLSVH